MRTRLTDLGSLADEAAAVERVTYEGTLEVEPHAEPVLVCVNQTEVRGIISNLLNNATRAAGPVGTVTIEISRHLGLAELVVQDTGPGFGEVPEGTGLGWRIMAQSLAKCEGKISYGVARSAECVPVSGFPSRRPELAGGEVHEAGSLRRSQDSVRSAGHRP